MTIGLTPFSVSTLLSRVRSEPPLVQCLTNTVVTNFTANVLLALGAAPAMTDIPGEAGPFARIASGVLINLGTPHAEQRTAMLEAAAAANDAGTPWVLDPVAVGSLPVRTALAAELLAMRPTVVRANASEVMALAGLGAGGRGVDATDVRFGPMTDEEILRYIRTGEPMDKAGAYALQGVAGLWIEEIRGSSSNVIGLPLTLTRRLLAECGLEVLPD